MRNKSITVMSYALLILFCWIVYPCKWIKKAVFNRRKRKAIEKAINRYNETGRHYHVVQNGLNFFVGDRGYFRQKRIKWNKRLRKLGVETDYRIAIIFTANEGTVNK